MKTSKKVLSTFLALFMVVTMFSGSAFAADSANQLTGFGSDIASIGITGADVSSATLTTSASNNGNDNNMTYTYNVVLSATTSAEAAVTATFAKAAGSGCTISTVPRISNQPVPTIPVVQNNQSLTFSSTLSSGVGTATAYVFPALTTDFTRFDTYVFNFTTGAVKNPVTSNGVTLRFGDPAYANTAPECYMSLEADGAAFNAQYEGPLAGYYPDMLALYMTYAGNNVISDAYRVGYSYQHGSDPTGAFIMPENNLLLLCTDPKGFRGLGHNSNVIGPDLDSWYATYHCLVAQTGPQRRYMVDRLLTDGALVTANGPSAIGSYVPKRPSFEARSSADFQQSGNLLLSSTETEAVFTAEYNFIPAANSVSRFIFGYTDEKNYTYASWDAAAKSLVLAEVSGGNEKEYGRATVDFASDEVLHTVRVEQGAARLLVYFDSMRKLDVEHSGAVGQIGVSGSSEWQYTAFSNDAFGTSDFETVKSVPGLFPATSYLKGENRGFSLRKATVKADGIRQGEREKTYVDTDSDTHALVLDARGDWVKYAIRVTEDSYHGVSARISTASAGARFQLIVDNEKVYTFTVPASGLDNGFAQLMLGQIPLTKGNHTLKLRLLQGQNGDDRDSHRADESLGFIL